MKKVIVLSVIALFICVSFIPSINANIDRLPVKSKLVETSVRIHGAKGITPYTVKLTEKQSDEVDRIFETIKVSLDSAVTGEEIDEIYDGAVESLYELGMFPKMTVDEAKQLVKGESVKSKSVNLGTGDENFNCRISGTASECITFNVGDLFRGYFVFNFILNLIRGYNRITYSGYANHFNFPYIKGSIRYMTFGNLFSERLGDYYTPSKGWVHTNGSNGVVKWEGEFYGNMDYLLVYEWERDKFAEWLFDGVSWFEGLWVMNSFLGNAEHVSLTYDKPPHPPEPW